MNVKTFSMKDASPDLEFSKFEFVFAPSWLKKIARQEGISPKWYATKPLSTGIYAEMWNTKKLVCVTVYGSPLEVS